MFKRHRLNTRYTWSQSQIKVIKRRTTSMLAPCHCKDGLITTSNYKVDPTSLTFFIFWSPFHNELKNHIPGIKIKFLKPSLNMKILLFFPDNLSLQSYLCCFGQIKPIQSKANRQIFLKHALCTACIQLQHAQFNYRLSTYLIMCLNCIHWIYIEVV